MLQMNGKIFMIPMKLFSLEKINLTLENFITKGYLWSRFFYLNIFFSCIIKLHKILKNEKPDFFIAHLVTSLPLLLFFLFNYRTKLILRISGEPKIKFCKKIFLETYF